ncbi:uncharacterized protein LOC117816986 [Notolabrus celidotus]|uniref:uncharacterized protein LOC117816986 n=1 Tax=Notolabrus celidotus TaxID=1203425 RepID=UPI00148FA1D3|nr:uncharacterized protein LOC117816986 [Notolabrus celidotus]
MEFLQMMKSMMKVMLVILLLQGSSAQTLRERSALVGTDVTLGCVFDKLSKQVEWSALTVEWYMVDKQSGKRTVYTFVDGRAHINRAGSVVDEMQLLQSDASLKLCNVTVGDEGLYTCRTITPRVYTETVSLKVQARPSVSLPEDAAVTEGQEKTIQCNITGYYPDKLALTWHIQNGSDTVPAAASPLFGVCTNMAVHNPDGTFSIRSGITLHSSAVTGGEMHLICRVEHQTYTLPYNRSVTLTVQAPSLPPHIVGTLLFLGSCLIFSMVAALIGISVSVLRRLHKAPPSVSQITPNIIYADVSTQLQCTIRGERKQKLRVKWIRLRRIIESDVPSESAPLLVREDDMSHKASLKSHGDEHISVLPVCLSVTEDKTRYLCVVQSRDKTVSRETTVQVKVEPSLLRISSIPQIPKVEKLLVLCCRVENFYPPDVDLVWFRSDGEQVSTIKHFGPFSAQNNLYSMWSKIELLMAREDESVSYTCRVYHTSFADQGFRDVLYHINTQGAAPNLRFIKCEPTAPLLNTECTLHLCIEDFCPEDATVTWTKNGEEVPSGVFNTPPSLNFNGLYSMFSFLKFTCAEDDIDAEFKCEVVHSAQKEPGEERPFTLPVLQMSNSC